MSYSSMILATTGLQHYYKLDETVGSTLADSKGSENLTVTGTSVAYGSTGLISGSLSGAWDTTGATSGIAKTSSHTALAGVGDFSYEGWIKTTNGTANLFLFGEGSGSSTNPVAYISNDNTFAARPKILVRNDAGTATSVAFAGVINDGKPHHLVLSGVRSTNFINLWLDGVNILVNLAYPVTPFTVTRFSIGGLSRTTDTSFFPSLYQHVATYNVALSAATIQQHYTAGVAAKMAFMDF